MTKILNREEVKRIVGQQPVAAGGGGGGDFDPTVLNGYATELWVDENYISIEFFSRLFQAHGTENGVQTDIDPNDTTSTITSIESMFGFWTDYYLSALGNGGGLGSTIYLSTLADVLISSPSNNQVLTYNATIGKWVNANAQAGVTQLSALSDVTIGTLANMQALIYNSITAKWENTALKTINGQSLVGSGDISVGGGASGNYLPLTGGTLTGAVIMDSVSDLYFYSGTSPCSYLGYDRNDNMTWIYNFGGQNSIRLYNASGIISLMGGNVGVNLTAPQYQFDVNGDAAAKRMVVKSGTNNGFISYETGMYQFTSSDVLRCYVGMNNTSDMFHIYLPSCQLRMNENSNGYVSLHTNTNNVLTLASSTNYAFISFDNSSHHGGWIGMSENNTITIARVGFDFNVDANGNVGIKTYSPSYTLHVNGTIYGSTGIYSAGYVTALSDIRKKDVLSTDIGLTVEDIADAPTIKFLWKDRRNEGTQVGSVAQFWGAYLPEVVMDRGGELSMQYGVAALVSAIITARKVVDHERRISELEKENERLKTEVEQLRLN